MTSQNGNLNNSHAISVGDTRIEYSINRGSRLRTRIVVAPDGRVEARVPSNVSDEWVQNYVHRQRRWIFRQQDYFERFRPREPRRRYVSGETFRYLGRQYKLEVCDGDVEGVRLKGRSLVVNVPERRDAEIEQLVQSWYRLRAQSVFGRRSNACFAQMRPYDVQECPIELRNMSRRWGSCTPRGRILLNPYLVVASTDCIDYVMIHEMCHVKHPRHDEEFYRLITTVMPDWPRRRERLEKCGPYLTL